ncbi:6_t:CDS:2, partial [Funneliformis caledonium]
KTKRLSATVLRVALVCGFSTTSSDTDQNTDDEERTSDSEMDSEMDISSNTDDSSEDGEVINVSNINNVRWTNKVVTIDPRQVSRSYSSTPVVHIADISKATPRQFFEQFIPVDFIMSVVIPSTNKSARECEQTTRVSLAFGQYMSHQRFRNIIKYLTLTDIPANDDPFHFAWQFHDEFNENLTKAILPVDKGPFQQKILRKPHSIGCEFKALADAQINLFLRLDPAEPLECAIKKKFLDQYPATKRRYWLKNIPSDITDVLRDTYRSLSAVDILNNLRDNSLSYHNILGSKRSADRIFAFYLTVAEANSFSAYCRFVSEKKNMKHVDFRKQLAKSIFNCYSNNTIADQTKKRRKLDSDNFEHCLTNLSSDPATSKLKAVQFYEEYVQIVGPSISI